jgi:leucyl aminopeptidase (aminopeptidase T)
MKQDKLYQAAERAVTQALRLRPKERFLLVTDRQKMEIAEALAFWAKKAGAETTTYLMTETLRPITEPTFLFKQLIAKAHVTAYLLEGRIQEKPFRGYMVANGAKTGRICMMPGITRDMMERLVAIDFSQLAGFTKRVVRAMKDAAEVTITNPAGTRITFSVAGRAWHTDIGDISKKGSHGNLPAGECYTAPVEETFTGRIVIGLIDDKMGRGVLEFKRGKLVAWSGKGVDEVVKTIGGDPTGRIVGEFGIGTNPGAHISPNMLEAEKAFGTVHFAIGDSYGIGKNKSKFHYDSLVDKVTIAAKGRTIAKDGQFLI